jgi:hypothetical protein
LNLNKDADRLSVRLIRFALGGWFVRGGGGCYLLQCWEEEEENEGWDRESRSPSHKLNITYEIIYEFHRWVNSVGNSIGINDMFLYILIFFNTFFSLCNFLGIYWEKIYVGIYRWMQRRNIFSVKFTAIYWRKNSIGISVCIYQFSRNAYCID